MTDLPRRLAADLGPRYTLVKQLGEGGMGAVFEFHDTLLDRPVAVKALRPEVASAETAERFVREARTLAQIAHPNIVQVFDVQRTSDGLWCIIMELVRGDTLRDALERGPLPAMQVRDIGVQLLTALEQAHGVGVVHRDVKPSNIFLSGGRVLLGDFGIARSPRHDDDTLTRPGQRLGTPPYMAPEQRAARPAGPATDLYACALVLYEAVTGRRLDPERANDPEAWKRVPPGLVPPLRRALEVDPAARWATAGEFREALLAASPLATGLRRSYVLGLGGMAVALLGIFAWQLWNSGNRREALPRLHVDLAIGEVHEAEAGEDRTRIARHLYSLLEAFQRIEVERLDADRDGGPPVRATFTVSGEVLAHGGDSLRVQLEVKDSTGELFENIVALGDRAEQDLLAAALADSIVCGVLTARCQEFRDVRPIAVNVQAQKAYFEGEDAFRRGDWALAERRFREALDRAPQYPLAAWNLMVARRYQRKDFSADLVRILSQFPRLQSLQRGLAEAQLEPDLHARFDRYEQLARAYPTSAYALLLYYNERFHRGPLIGIPLAETLDSMSRLATEIRAMQHTSQYDLTIWGYVRLGNEAAALREYRRRREIAAPGDAYGPLHLHAIHSRFSPWRAWVERRWLAFDADSAAIDVLAQKDRLGLSMDIPEAQVDLGRLLVDKGRSVEQRGTGLVGQALGQVMLGRPARGLALLDSAADLLATPEMRLQQAEWPVGLAVLGLPADSLRLRRALAALEATDGGLPGARARFLLGAEALGRGDTAHAARLAAALRDEPADVARRLGTLLAALAAGRAGRLEEALAVSRAVFRLDSAAYAMGPFARAVTYLRRGEWLAARGDAAAADAAWMWYENSDMTGWPVGAPQQGEVDAMLAPLARLHRGELAARRGDGPAACVHLRRVHEAWHDAEPAWSALLARVRRAREGAGCP